jgi:glycerophosphoryl diester phosphodiesterase
MKHFKETCFLLISLVLLLTAAPGCKAQKSNTASSLPFLKQGHRGTRGLMPENTIPAMKKGIVVGANTIELDVHISKDNQVLVYHDASPNPEYTLFANGSEIPKADRKKYTFYQINYNEARQFLIGRKTDKGYPQQQQLDTYMPLLGELIDSVEQFTRSNVLPAVYYNVEIKSNKETDAVEQPAPEELVKLVMDVLEKKKLGRRLFIQSFDERPLQVIHAKYPGVTIGYLTSDKNASFEDNIAKIGFMPDFYNPHYSLVNKELVDKVHAKKGLICPWTVQLKDEMLKLKELGVDGIISDYPNLLQGL